MTATKPTYKFYKIWFCLNKFGIFGGDDEITAKLIFCDDETTPYREMKHPRNIAQVARYFPYSESHKMRYLFVSPRYVSWSAAFESKEIAEMAS